MAQTDEALHAGEVVDGDEFQDLRRSGLVELRQAPGQDELIVAVVLEPQHYPLVARGGSHQPIMLDTQLFNDVRLRQAERSAEGIGDEPRADRLEIGNVGHRPHAVGVGVFQEIAGEAGIAQRLPDVGAAPDMKRREVAVGGGACVRLSCHDISFFNRTCG